MCLGFFFTTFKYFRLQISVFHTGTDIHGGLMKGINMLIQDRQANRLPERSTDMIILLTDGMPNSGKRADCFHIERQKTVASYFHLLSLCICRSFWPSINPKWCAFCHWREYIPFLPWIWKRCRLFILGCAEQTKPRTGSQNLWSFRCCTSASGK